MKNEVGEERRKKSAPNPRDEADLREGTEQEVAYTYICLVT